MPNSTRLGLPFLAAGQALKEFFHNEALQSLDLLVAAAVEEPPRNSPPAAPADGACYVVGTAPSGAWTGRAGQIAAFVAGGWRYVAPVEGMGALVKSSGLAACYRSGTWEIGLVRAQSVLVGGTQVVGVQQPAIAAPVGGSTVDTGARTAIGEILAALRSHGLVAS